MILECSTVCSKLSHAIIVQALARSSVLMMRLVSLSMPRHRAVPTACRPSDYTHFGAGRWGLLDTPAPRRNAAGLRHVNGKRRAWRTFTSKRVRKAVPREAPSRTTSTLRNVFERARPGPLVVLDLIFLQKLSEDFVCIDEDRRDLGLG